MANTDLPTGIVTFLFSDIEGSTRLLQRVGIDAYQRALEEHNEIFRDIAGPAVVSTEGDSFFCAFAEAGAAVDAAVAVQRALMTAPWGDGIELKVRMGLHTGEGMAGGDDYVGLDVHRAARIAAAGHGGQIVASAATVERLGNTGTVSARDLGEHRLKDLAHPVWLYQLEAPGLPVEFPRLRTVDAPVVSLPAYPTTFVGRERELEELRALVGASRLVTLVGPGGAGKTRLAVAAAATTAARFDAGARFVSFADLDDGALAAAHVAATLGVSEQVGGSIESALAAHIGAQQLLVVFDNCEHLVADTAALAQRLLLGCPRLHILATSREALLVDGEHRFEVGALGLPDPDDARDGLPAAVQLFADRAAAVAPDFELDRWLGDCVEICVRLDGIPLAIELAAARCDVLSPQEIRARLDDRFALLRRRSRGPDPRHSTLEAAIEWSYELLGPEAQRVLRSASVCRGGFTLEAVEQLTGGPGGEGYEIVDALAELREKSMVTRKLGMSGSRFFVGETIREYALTRAREEEELERLEAAHRGYYTMLASRESRRLGGGEQLEALAVLESEHDNMRAVMRRAVDAGEFDSAAAIAGRLAWFWYIHAHFTEGDAWGDRLLEQMPEDPRRVWLWLLLGAAQYDERIGRYERAAERLGLAVDLARKAGDGRIEMWSHAYLATNDFYRGEMDAAGPEVEAAVSLAESLGDQLGLGYATFIGIGVEAWLLDNGGRLDADSAHDLLARVDPMHRWALASGDRNMVGHFGQLEALLSARAGDHRGAASSFSRALTALTELGTVGCACHCLEAASEVLASLGYHGAAARIIGSTAALRERIGIGVSPAERYFRERAESTAAETLGPDGVRRELEAGRDLGLTEASELARGALARIAG